MKRFLPHWAFVAAIVPLLGGCALLAPDRLSPAPLAGAEAPWLYRGSNVPQDMAWRFGELPNGLRYAIRRNGVPPGQLSIRVRIDAGSLHETDAERGYAHFIEHLAFRGSAHVADGEAKRIWQRLGATFGADSNAVTSPVSTTYRLDLPRASFESTDQSLKILSGMMMSPAITMAAVNAERPVILAENREQSAPAVAVADAARALLFAGQPLADRSPIGTPASIAAATPDTLAGFHARWYRPSRTVIAISGSGDPAIIETLLQRHFGEWQGAGEDPGDPPFGDPDPDAPRVAALVQPSLPSSVRIAWLRPWRPVADTIAYNRGLMLTALAQRIVNRRLEDRARAGAAFLIANLEQDDIARSADTTQLNLVVAGDQWQAAARQARVIVEQARTFVPTRAEIDREADAFELALAAAVENAPAERSAEQVDDLVAAVDIRETVTTPEAALAIFRSARRDFTPGRVRAATRRLFEGNPPRILVITPTAEAGIEGAAQALLDAPLDVAPPTGLAGPRIDSFAALPGIGRPGAVVARDAVPPLDLQTVRFSNGATLLLWPNQSEAGRVYVNVRFGRGRAGLAADTAAPLWSAPALAASGIGRYGADALDRLSTGRQIALEFGIGDDAYSFSAVTRSADLADQLRLIAAKLAAPGWDPVPVERMKAQLLAGYGSFDASPDGVLARDIDGLLRNGDRRWATPSRDDIMALTPATFRAFWAARLAEGPVELAIFGDVDADKAIEAARRTIGAIAPRADAPRDGDPVAFPQPRADPLVLSHAGPQNQAAVAIAWPTGSGPDAETERALQLLASVFTDRLFETLRSVDGLSYSPAANSDWPQRIGGAGHILVGARVAPEDVGNFLAASRAIARDLATTEISADEFARALDPARQFYQRAFSGNTFLLRTLAGAANDPARFVALRAIPRSLDAMNPSRLREAARRYLTPEAEWSVVVLPEAVAEP